jgi:hypothetical protein
LETVAVDTPAAFATSRMVSVIFVQKRSEYSRGKIA